MPSQNKIEKTLGAELARFCERLRKERNVTLQKIADFYQEETGEYVSLMRDSDSRVRALERTIKFREQAAAKAVLSDPELRGAIAEISRNQSMGEEEKIEAVRKRLFGERPSDFSPVTTTGAAYVS